MSAASRIRAWYHRHRYARQYQEVARDAAWTLQWGFGMTTMERFTRNRLRADLKRIGIRP